MSPIKKDFAALAGVIAADEVWALPEFQRSFRLGRHAVRAMRRHGLKVHRVANRAYVTGRDFIDFIERQPTDGEEPGETAS